MRQEDGFTLIEMICVLGIIALLAALAFPSLTPGSAHAEIEAYAIRIASLLKADRSASMLNGSPVATGLSPRANNVKSGSSSMIVQLPTSIALNAVLARRCAGSEAGSVIAFFPSGISCGGVISLAQPGFNIEIRVNWLTGGIEIVRIPKS